MKQLGLGFIGCGEIARSTAKAVSEVESARIAAVYDPNPDSARDIAEPAGAEVVATVEELLACDDVAAVYIASPHFLHAGQALAAMDAGKHVCVEKPMAIDLDDARKMVKKAKEAGLVLSVPFIMRYFPSAQRARELIREGAIGEVICYQMSDMQYKPPAYWEKGVSGKARPTDWRSRRDRAGGGILIMNSIHSIDLMRHLTGLDVERVYCEQGTYLQPVEVEDLSMVVMRLSNGAVATIEAATAAWGRKPGCLPARVYGTGGQIGLAGFWDDPSGVHVFRREKNDWEFIETPAGPATRADYMREFAAASAGEGSCSVSAEDGLRAVEVVLAAYESAEKGRPAATGE